MLSRIVLWQAQQLVKTSYDESPTPENVFLEGSRADNLGRQSASVHPTSLMPPSPTEKQQSG